MALSEVILLERVENLGQMGDLVRVRPGYARNFLLPTGKAIRATAANKARFEQERVQLEARNIAKREEAERLAERLTGFSVTLIRQAGEAGNLYGSVTPRDIAEAITEAAANVTRQQVVLEEPIKSLGLVDAKVQLHPEVVLTVVVNVARSKEEAERQARGEEAVVVEEDENVLQGLQDEIREEDLAEENIRAEAEQA